MNRFLPLATILAATAGVAQTPAVHTFTPERFYNTFSFAHPPALRIKPGDRVMTRTIDAAGADWNGKSVAQGPNPQTGPFLVEGAEQGDMLVVTFMKMEINRATAYSSGALAPYTVTPRSILNRTERQAPRANWILDKAKNVARLDNNDIGGLELRLRPMLVASASRPRARRRSRPARPARSAATWTMPA
ncbi:MAG: acetamidase/formamidase family protein [Cyanobacteria bacterium]|nr:acetamidase/formamidase family protein [Cyanobacteriota bacterium]